MTKSIVDQFSLYLTEGSSDKEYHADLVKEQGGYRVLARYGRRGGTLKHEEKTNSPVDMDSARKIFADLKKAKTKKGYTSDESGAVYHGHENAGLASGERLSLLTKIDRVSLDGMIDDPDYFMQQKIDGERRAVKSDDKQIYGINKQNMRTPLPLETSNALNSLINKFGAPGDYLVDAEIVGSKLYVFDLLRMGGQSVGGGALSRVMRLKSIMENNDSPLLEMVRTAITAEEKIALIEEVIANDLEGIAAKEISSGESFKYKFYEECSVLVTSHNNGKRSVGISVMNRDIITEVGNVTIPANKEIPDIGSILEVKYLYAYEGGSLFQPVYNKPRTDINSPDDADSLKYKPTSQSMRP